MDLDLDDSPCHLCRKFRDITSERLYELNLFLELQASSYSCIQDIEGCLSRNPVSFHLQTITLHIWLESDTGSDWPTHMDVYHKIDNISLSRKQVDPIRQTLRTLVDEFSFEHEIPSFTELAVLILALLEEMISHLPEIP